MKTFWERERVEKQGSESNNKTMVCRVFLLAINTRVEIESQFINLGETLLVWLGIGQASLQGLTAWPI